MSNDPTREEMTEYLNENLPYQGEDFSFDIEAAIYWFANDYHSGQSSNLYNALSTSPYCPGPTMSGIDSENNGFAEDFYNMLKGKFIFTNIPQ